MESITKSRKKLTDFNFAPLFTILAVLNIVITFYIAYNASLLNENVVLSVSLLSLFGGLLFESFRITESAKKILFTIIGAYFFSLFFCIPGIIDFNFGMIVRIWPYAFILFFMLGIVTFNKEKVTAQLTEGVTLLLSLSIIYWVIDYGFLNIENWFMKSILIFGLLISLFSILNGLTSIKLTPAIRLALSIWSTIIMLIFGIDNAFSTFSNGEVDATQLFSEISIVLQYFLLGISSVYILKHLFLIVSFSPGKGEQNYKKHLAEITKEHLDRFAPQQVNIRYSLFCILYSGIIYALNYKFHFLPRPAVIWLVFVTFPLIPYFFSKTSKGEISE